MCQREASSNCFTEIGKRVAGILDQKWDNFSWIHKNITQDHRCQFTFSYSLMNESIIQYYNPLFHCYHVAALAITRNFINLWTAILSDYLFSKMVVIVVCLREFSWKGSLLLPWRSYFAMGFIRRFYPDQT